MIPTIDAQVAQFARVGLTVITIGTQHRRHNRQATLLVCVSTTDVGSVSEVHLLSDLVLENVSKCA